MQLKYAITITPIIALLIACNTSRKTIATAPPANNDSMKVVSVEKPISEVKQQPKKESNSVLSGMSILTPPGGQSDSVFVGFYEVVAPPGEKQLTAIQEKYPGITMETLRLGHELFNGTCTNCHNQKSIYARTEDHWKVIVDDMAPLAELTIHEKDAVMKYVLSVKATQPNQE